MTFPDFSGGDPPPFLGGVLAVGLLSARWRNTHFTQYEYSRLDGVQKRDFLFQGIPINSEFHSLFRHFVDEGGHGVCNITPHRDGHGGGYWMIAAVAGGRHSE